MSYTLTHPEHGTIRNVKEADGITMNTGVELPLSIRGFAHWQDAAYLRAMGWTISPDTPEVPATRNSDRVSPGSEVPVTNDPTPWRYHDGQRRSEPLNQDAGNPFASLWTYDPRPGFESEVPADEGTTAHRLAIAMLGNDEGGFIDGSAELPAGEMYRLASDCIAAELQKARAEEREKAAKVVERQPRDRDGYVSHIATAEAIRAGGAS